MTIYVLLFVFAVLSIKNLTPFAGPSQAENCNEFGHIHFYKIQKMVEGDASYEASSSKDEDCHEGKSVAAHDAFPSRVFELVRMSYETVFSRVPVFENHFKSPFLEPPRKPPRFA